MSINIFTDNALERWKKELAKWNAQQPITYFKINSDEMNAFLARLEAAEEVCERAKTHGCEDPECGLDASLNAWHKAAGK